MGYVEDVRSTERVVRQITAEIDGGRNADGFDEDQITKWFALQMKQQRNANAYMGCVGWRRRDIASLVDWVREELVELEAEVNSGGSDEALIREAADVANMAMMVAHLALVGEVSP